MEWQPIETAPRDGTWFLICNASNDDDRFSYEVGRYDPYMTPEYVEVEGGLFRKDMRSSYDWAGFNNFHQATHWMPLPNPPTPLILKSGRRTMDKEMMKALESDGEKLRQITGEDHGPVFPHPEQCAACFGEGSLEIPDPQRDDPYYCRVVKCLECDGNGWV